MEKGKGARGKLTGQEALAKRKLVRGIESEKELGNKINEMMPAIDKEEAVGSSDR